jgi:hypothetical protein
MFWDDCTLKRVLCTVKALLSRNPPRNRCGLFKVYPLGKGYTYIHVTCRLFYVRWSTFFNSHFFLFIYNINLLQEFWWLQASSGDYKQVLVITSKFLYTYYGVCMCDYPWSAPHVLPIFGLPCLVHCPSVLVVNCSESSGYGCDAGFVFFSAITGSLRYVHGLQKDTYYLFPSCQSFKVYVCPRDAG